MKKLKEHRQFIRQLFVMTFICFVISFIIHEVAIFTILLGLISIWNISNYMENMTDYNKLKEGRTKSNVKNNKNIEKLAPPPPPTKI